MKEKRGKQKQTHVQKRGRKYRVVRGDVMPKELNHVLFQGETVKSEEEGGQTSEKEKIHDNPLIPPPVVRYQWGRAVFQGWRKLSEEGDPQQPSSGLLSVSEHALSANRRHCTTESTNGASFLFSFPGGSKTILTLSESLRLL